jgi:hypothetical protein
MSTNVNMLELVWAERFRLQPGNQKERHFLDFLLDGVSLRELSQYQDAITPLGGWATPDFEAGALDVLLCDRRPVLMTGRAQLYVYAECATSDAVHSRL